VSTLRRRINEDVQVASISTQFGALNLTEGALNSLAMNTTGAFFNLTIGNIVPQLTFTVVTPETTLPYSLTDNEPRQTIQVFRVQGLGFRITSPPINPQIQNAPILQRQYRAKRIEYMAEEVTQLMAESSL
jgi:hypothetical protein